MSTKREQFGRLGVILAAAGSAVGLGNIWKFPYMIGENGGAAFLVVYLGCVLLFGVPVMSAEFYIGRCHLRNKRWLQILTMCISTLFFAFYLVVTGWCFHYLYLSIINATSSLSPTELADGFQQFTSGRAMPILWMVVGMLLTAMIEVMGIKQGIERVSKILMPMLFVVLILMIIRGLTMPGSGEGLRFLLDPDFGKITPDLVLSAMGQCFFSLSIGAGSLATYASYMNQEQNLPATSMRVIGLDTLVAILAGMAIFPAVFALGIDPTEGPELVFVTLPSVFAGIPGGQLFQILFFLLLAIASLTSTISLMEVELGFLCREERLSRKAGIAISATIVLALGILAVMSTTVFGWMDELVSKYLLPFGGMIFALYVGWGCDKDEVVRHMTPKKMGAGAGKTIYYLVRYLIPPIILLIFLDGLNIW